MQFFHLFRSLKICLIIVLSVFFPPHDFNLWCVCRETKPQTMESCDGPTQVFLKMPPPGQVLCLDVDLNQGVSQLYQALEREDKSDCFLIHGIKSIPPVGTGSQSLRALGVEANSTIHVCVRQRGGCFAITIFILTVLFLAALSAPFTCGASLIVFPFLLPLLLVLPLCCL